MKKYFNLLSFLIATLWLYGCANKVTPTGGIRDTVPPELLSASPENRNTEFNSKLITLTFDEYVQLKDISKQLVISPPILPTPVISVKKKNVTIELDAVLKPNTTYSINFGNSIVDNNEGNPLAGYQYIFSTGSFIDSLVVSGQVVEAKTLKPLKDAVVMLYHTPIADSLWLQKSPDYFSKTDSSGFFQINNISAGKYRIFALADKNNNYLFDNAEELIAFEKEEFELKDTAKFNLRAFKQTAEKQSVKYSALDASGKLTTGFVKPLINVSWQVIGGAPAKVITEYSNESDTLFLYAIPAFSDSTKIIWFENQSVIDTILYTIKKSMGSEKISTSAKDPIIFYPANGTALTKGEMPFFKWMVPIQNFDNAKILVEKDSVDIAIKTHFVDSAQTKISLNTIWTEGNYLLRLLPGAITDIYGRVNDSIGSTFSVPAEKTTGGIHFNLSSSSSINSILQLINDKDDAIRTTFFNGAIKGVFDGLIPGTYRLRVISDLNQNGKWDTGDFRHSVQPEHVIIYRESIVVRANWEVEIDWSY